MPEISISAEAEKNIHPVSVLPSDQPLSQPSPGMALCLSGGGYRAMLFHLGTLWRLNELGLLKGLKRISSVSGGSITARMLGLAWKNLTFVYKAPFLQSAIDYSSKMSYCSSAPPYSRSSKGEQSHEATLLRLCCGFVGLRTS